MVRALVMCVMALLPLRASAQILWSGASSTAWTQAGNWTPMTVPDVPTTIPQVMPTHSALVGPNSFNRAAVTGSNNWVELLTLHVGVGGKVEISGASGLEVYSGGNALHVEGLIDMHAPVNGNRLAIGADTTLFGGGEIIIRGGSIRGITNNLAPNVERLTNVDVLIHGSGRIGGDLTIHQSMALTNRAQIVADTAGQTLLIDTPLTGATSLNTGLMIARNGGILSLARTDFSPNSSPLTNFEVIGGGATLLGTIRAEANSRVDVQGVAVNGGFMDVVGSGEISMRGGAVLDAGILNSATGIIRASDSTNQIRSSLVNPAGGRVLIDSSTLGIAGHPQTRNDGTIQISGGTLEANVELLSDFTLRGGGTLEMGTATRRGTLIGSSNAGTELFVNQDNLIRGQGILGSNSFSLRLNNHGTIAAHLAAKELQISAFTDATTPLVNSGTILATNGGIATISLAGSTDATRRIQNSSAGIEGNLRAEGAGVLQLTNVFVDGGVVETLFDGAINTRNAVTLKPASLNLDGPLNNITGNLHIESPIIVSLNGELVNNSSGTTTIGPATTFGGFALNASVQGTVIVQSIAPAAFGIMNVGGTLDVRTLATAAEIDGTGTTRVGLGARLDAFRVRTRNVLVDTGGKLAIVDSPANPLPDQVSRVTQITFGTGGRIDLGAQALVRDLTSGTTDAQLLAWIISGRAGGTWNGIGINTSAPTANHALGFAVAANLFTTFPQTWLGQSIDSSTSLVRYTLKGDCNLDGDVDFDDLLIIAQNYGASSRLWHQGDSDYNGSVNFDDLLSVAQNYGHVVVRDDADNSRSDNFENDWLLARSLVPEPVSVLPIGLAARRRRR